MKSLISSQSDDSARHSISFTELDLEIECEKHFIHCDGNVFLFGATWNIEQLKDFMIILNRISVYSQTQIVKL